MSPSSFNYIISHFTENPVSPFMTNGDSSLPVMVLIIELDLQNGWPFRTVIKPDVLGPHSDNLLYPAFLRLSLTWSTSLREKRPYSSQLATNSLKFHWVNLVTGSNFVKLVVFARIHHLAHYVVMMNIAEDSGCSVEFPAQSVLCQHVRV
jgi:hypothetical protein